MARRSSSDGTIYQLPSGSWRAQISLHGKRWSATRATKVLARDWIRQIGDQVEQGLTYEGSQIRLGDFIGGWMEIKRGHLRGSTVGLYSRAIRLHIIPHLSRYKLSDLSRGLIQAWVEALEKKGAGVRMIEVAHMVLHNSLEHARQIGLITGNPAEMVMLPKREQSEMLVWTESQVSQFLTAIQGNTLEGLYQMALATGMRRGELLGLRWSDIDWIGMRVQVTRQAVEVTGGGYTFGPPKTARGQRSVEIGAGMIERLRRQEKKVYELRRVFHNSWIENDLVFPCQRGGPHRGANIDRHFRALARQAGVPVIRFHDLRHTAATIMLSHGIPPVIVAGMLGHTLSVLMTRYAHYIPSMQGEAARLMDDVTGVFQITHELPTRGKGYRQG